MGKHPPYPPTVINPARNVMSARDGLEYPLERFVAAGADIYVARVGANDPRITYQERWLFPDRGWAVIRWTRAPDAAPFGYDWYVDLDRIEVTKERWSIHDRYLDVIVREGEGYEVLDADELADAVEAGRWRSMRRWRPSARCTTSASASARRAGRWRRCCTTSRRDCLCSRRPRFEPASVYS